MELVSGLTRLYQKSDNLYFDTFSLSLNKNNSMFFDNYKLHQNSKVRDTLLWEYDMDRFNWEDMRNLVVQRVIERGRMDDFYAILNLYGLSGVKEAIRQIPYLNARDLSFVCSVFNLKKESLKCYTKQQSTVQHWNS
jgi:hypothetical protein